MWYKHKCTTLLWYKEAAHNELLELLDKFVGALKVAPKLVASDQKIGRSWMLATPMDREHARLCATKVWHIYTCATCATNVAQVWHTKGASHVF